MPFHLPLQKCHTEIAQKREKLKLAQVKGNMNHMMNELKDKLALPSAAQAMITAMGTAAGSPRSLKPLSTPKGRVRAPTTGLLME
jgi:hypothetical protein